jgi:hypothetical protein
LPNLINLSIKINKLKEIKVLIKEIKKIKKLDKKINLFKKITINVFKKKHNHMIISIATKSMEINC